VDVERIRDFLRRHREGELHFPAGAERADRWVCERNYRARKSADRLLGGVTRCLQKLERSDGRDGSDRQPDKSADMAPPDR
jgi:hypothetical protein